MRAQAVAGMSSVSPRGRSLASPAAAAAAAAPPMSPVQGGAVLTDRHAWVDPIERSQAAVQRAQAVAARHRTQAAAMAAVAAKQAQAAERTRSLQEIGEAKVAAAQRDLAASQAALKHTSAALDAAQAVLADRNAKLNEARGKLATLMSMTRDLLRLVKPVAQMRQAARRAAESAERRLTALSDSASPASAAVEGRSGPRRRLVLSPEEPGPSPPRTAEPPARRQGQPMPPAAGAAGRSHAPAGLLTTATAAADVAPTPEFESPTQGAISEVEARLAALAAKLDL